MYVLRAFRAATAYLKAVLLPAVPSSVHAGLAGVLEAALHDLDPVTRAVIIGDLARSLGDVDEARTGMLNLLVVEELEAELVTSLDVVGLKRSQYMSHTQFV